MASEHAHVKITVDLTEFHKAMRRASIAVRWARVLAKRHARLAGLTRRRLP